MAHVTEFLKRRTNPVRLKHVLSAHPSTVRDERWKGRTLRTNPNLLSPFTCQLSALSYGPLLTHIDRLIVVNP